MGSWLWQGKPTVVDDPGISWVVDRGEDGLEKRCRWKSILKCGCRQGIW